MVVLCRPAVRLQRSFLDAADEFVVAGENRHTGILVLPADEQFPGIAFDRAGLEDGQEFARLVDYLVGAEQPAQPRPAGWAPSTTWWLTVADDPDRFVGSISLRHNIIHPVLRDYSGHIGYSVRPSARRRGHAADALRQVLPIAAGRGLEQVLVTCDLDNTASRRVIESCGGSYEGDLEGKRRFWIATG